MIHRHYGSKCPGACAYLKSKFSENGKGFYLLGTRSSKIFGTNLKAVANFLDQAFL